jgi:hypothetical protein
MNCSMQDDKAPFVADGGLAQVATSDRDPYEALDDLMVVVEALCPKWPPRPATTRGPFKL